MYGNVNSPTVGIQSGFAELEGVMIICEGSASESSAEATLEPCKDGMILYLTQYLVHSARRAGDYRIRRPSSHIRPACTRLFATVRRRGLKRRHECTLCGLAVPALAQVNGAATTCAVFREDQF